MRFVVLILVWLLSSSAFAASVYQDGNYLVVSAHGKVRKLSLPSQLVAATSYSVKINPKQDVFSSPSMPGLSGGGGGGMPGMGNGFGGSSPSASPNKPKPRNLSSILVQANRLFRKKKFEEALNLLDLAEGMSPKNARVKAMKGSLFYLMGWKQYAQKFWNESLEINPEQPKVQSYLDKMGGGRVPAESTGEIEQ